MPPPRLAVPADRRGLMRLALCLVCFLSGAAALLFETLWFRLAGLSFGNSVWASSLVLSSFMGGLALGNGLAARRAGWKQRPVRTYAALEATVAVTGVALVLVLPRLGVLLAPALRPFVDSPLPLNALRLSIAFALLLVPATAMGATLPVLVPALSGHESGFGPALGRLYGWNTLGAVAGALAGEVLLVRVLGLRGTGITAGLLSGLAALSAMLVARDLDPASGFRDAAPAVTPGAAGPRRARLQAAAFVAGATLLALEVVWFRFLTLFADATSLAFAVMLAAVLLGIGTGGLAGSAWLRRQRDAFRYAPAVALLAGAASALAYVALAGSPGPGYRPFLAGFGEVALLSLRLMFPTSLLSGLLFTLLGRSLKEAVGEQTRTAAALTFSNTVGAMCGALTAGFLLLPRFGMERSFFALSLCYAAVAWLGRAGDPVRGRLVMPAAAATFALPLALFPFGLMRNHYLPGVLERFTRDGSRPVAFREGLNETIVYLQKDLFGEPAHHRLVTNGFSMSATTRGSARYMKLFVYWPVALHPGPRRALLVSYGVGTTAKALTDTAELEAIDVVDISREILETSSVVYPPAAHPLRDPRVRVHVEDGRFFLLTTEARYDLITSEPPPPRNAGVVNLYSADYFRLVHSRLARGGVATYWLPIIELSPASSRAIIAAFCDAFPDCSLWNADAINWMLAGTRGLQGPVSEERFGRQWAAGSAVVAELRALGFETPEQLGATFIGDAPFLRGLVAGDSAVTDDHPQRLGVERPPHRRDPWYVSLLAAHEARARFEQSQYVRALWPAGLRQRTARAFDVQRLVNDAFWWLWGLPDEGQAWYATLHAALTGSAPRSIVWLTLATDAGELAIAERAAARGVDDPWLDYLLGARALGERDYLGAERHFQAAARGSAGAHGGRELLALRALSLCLAGDPGRAEALAGPRTNRPPQEAAFWSWLAATFGNGTRP